MVTTQLVLALSLVALAVGVGLYKRDNLHPAVLLAGQWGLVGVAYAVAPHPFRRIDAATSLLITAASVAFVLASLSVGSRLHSTATAAYRTTAMRPILFWIALLGLPAYGWQAQELASTADFSDSFFINLRIALTRDDDAAVSYGAIGYLLPVAFVSTLVELASSKARLFELRGWLSLATSITYAMLATGRTFIFLLFIALAFIALVQRRVRPAQLVLGSVVFVVLGFFGLGVLINKVGDGMDNTAALTALDAFTLYSLSGLAAFDLAHALPSALEWGLNVFRSPLAVAKAVGVDVTVLPLVKEYVFVPEPTNVYTVMLPYVRDFSWPGLLFFFALFGRMHGSLYWRAQLGDPRCAVLYGLSVYPLLMQFFQDQYVSLLTTWVQLSVLAWLSFRRRPVSGAPV